MRIEPIPLSLVQAGRDLTEPRVSPDGRRVGFVQRWRANTSISVVDIAGGRPERPLTFGPDPAPGRGLGGGCFTWVGDTTIVYCATDGELWWQDGMRLERLTDHGRTVRGPSVAEILDRRRWIVYAVDEAEIWTVDLDTGDTRRLDDGRHAFCFDPAISPDGRTVSWQGWSPPDMPWDGSERVDLDLEPDGDSGRISSWRPADGAVQQPRFTRSGERVHVHDGSGWLNLHAGDRHLLDEPVEHAGPSWGMGNRTYAVDPSGGRVAFTRNDAGFGSLCMLDPTTGDVEQIGRGVHGHLTWVGDRIVALRTGARTPDEIVVYRDRSWERSSVATSQPEAWPRDALPEPVAVVTESTVDGLKLHARRYAADQGRMIVHVHGGPTDQWRVDWRPRILYWWSRGWDVLVVDPRGTTGHGRAYQQALHGRWGRADVDDTADLVAHAHGRGWAGPASTVMLGGSSGGLTVLGVLADHPQLVAGGVASSPVSDLRALAAATHRFEAHYTDTLVGPRDGSAESDATYRDLSPISRAGSIAGPLLLFHGADDPVVPVEQSTELARRITDAGGDVTYVVYEGEGHGFRQSDNVADEYAKTEAFLDRLVGRRSS